MNPKLSERMLIALRAIDAQSPAPLTMHATVRALWRRGLITYRTTNGKWDGYELTPEGALALKNVRQMLSRREP